VQTETRCPGGCSCRPPVRVLCVRWRLFFVCERVTFRRMPVNTFFWGRAPPRPQHETLRLPQQQLSETSTQLRPAALHWLDNDLQAASCCGLTGIWRRVSCLEVQYESRRPEFGSEPRTAQLVPWCVLLFAPSSRDRSSTPLQSGFRLIQVPS
jgi:hypothetical protein